MIVTYRVPRNCPCGRPRSGGTFMETAKGDVLFVEFSHADGACFWQPQTGRRWARTFVAAA